MWSELQDLLWCTSYQTKDCTGLRIIFSLASTRPAWLWCSCMCDWWTNGWAPVGVQLLQWGIRYRISIEPAFQWWVREGWAWKTRDRTVKLQEDFQIQTWQYPEIPLDSHWDQVPSLCCYNTHSILTVTLLEVGWCNRYKLFQNDASSPVLTSWILQ